MVKHSLELCYQDQFVRSVGLRMSKPIWKPERPDLLKKAMREAAITMGKGAVIILIGIMVMAFVILTVDRAGVIMALIWALLGMFTLISAITYTDKKIMDKHS